VEKVLHRRGVGRTTARQIAWPLVAHSYERGLDPAFVVSIMLNESGGRPTATSPVGARGLMQVMPSWTGHWRDCGRNLYDIEANLCNGTSILAWYLRRASDERRALLGYNGCVRGTNTPNCARYPDRIIRLKQQIQRELNAARRG
jgi:soluble lytic murein transglycosylase-like protein